MARSIMVRFQVRKIDVLDTFLGITEACDHLAGGPANVHVPSGLRHGEGGWGTLNWGSQDRCSVSPAVTMSLSKSSETTLRSSEP